MYKRIVVPLDGSRLAEQILSAVKSIAAASQAKVYLLGVVDNSAYSANGGRGHQEYLDIMCAQAVTAANEYLRKLAGQLKLAPDRVHAEAKIGHVAQTIVEEAEKEPDTLIAMSTHGESGIARLLLGSVADKVLQTAKSPLLLFRPSEGVGALGTSYLTNLIVPLDGSDWSEQVLPHAREMAKALGLRITFVLATPSTFEQVVGFASMGEMYVPLDLLEDMDAWAEEYLAAQVAATKKAGLEAGCVHLKGDAGAQLVDYIKATPNSMVAIATHGHSGIRRAALGSVANKVVRQAGVPTLVIRPRQPPVPPTTKAPTW